MRYIHIPKCSHSMVASPGDVAHLAALAARLLSLPWRLALVFGQLVTHALISIYTDSEYPSTRKAIEAI